MRIERRLRDGSRPLRLCAFDSAGTECVGPKPAIGDQIDVVDSSHYLGAVRVTAIDPTPPGCDAPALWHVQIDDDQLERTAEKAPERDGMGAFGIVGLELDPARARAVAPPAVAGDEALRMFGVDADGDGQADVAFRVSQCPDQAKRAEIFCVEVFAREHDRDLALLRRDLIEGSCIRTP